MPLKPEDYLYGRTRRYLEKFKRVAAASEDYVNGTLDSALAYDAGEHVSHVLYTGRKNGRYGWWDENVISDDALRDMLTEAVEGSDMGKVITYAAMLDARRHIRIHAEDKEGAS